MKIVVFGGDAIGRACLEVLLEAHADVIAVVAAPDDPSRQAAGGSRSMRELAQSRSLRCLTPGDVNAPDAVESIRSLRPDLFFLFDYPQHVGPALLALPKRGALNIYATEIGFFTQEERSLLEEIGFDISIALEKMDLAKEHNA